MIDATTQSGIHYTYADDDGREQPTLVLVMGYTGSGKAWNARFLELLARDTGTRLLIVDNRGTGKSVKPKEQEAYAIGLLAQDLEDVLTHAGVTRAHVLGYSLGGCIVQEHAFAHPARVASLFLVATTAGGALYTAPAPEVMDTLTNPQGDTILEKLLATWRVCMGRGALRRYELELVKNFLDQLPDVTPRYVFFGHMHAYKSFDRSGEVGSLTVPVTVLTGADDRLAPPQNSLDLAAAIPNATLVTIPSCEHMPHFEKAPDLVAAITTALRLLHP